MKDIENIRKNAKDMGFTVTDVVASPRTTVEKTETFRTVCATDRCGNYNRSWTCPPAVGSIVLCMERLHGYDECIIAFKEFENVDMKDEAQINTIIKEHQAGCRSIKHMFMDEGFDILALTDGACSFCEKCTYPDGECIAPEEQMPSVSGFGIDMAEYITSCGLGFAMENDRITLYGLMLYR